MSNHSSSKFSFFNIILPLIFALLTIGALFIGFQAGMIYNEDENTSLKKAMTEDDTEEKIPLILNYIKDNYVDSINTEQLQNDAITALLHQLDPHSDYIPPREFSEVKEEMQGNFEGIGIEFDIIQDTIRVVQTIPNGPSEKSGILAGDKIVSVDDSVVAGVHITTEKVFKKLRGPKGTKVKLDIKRNQVNQILYFTIERDKIPLHSVDVYDMLTDDIGYIRIERMAQNTVKEFEDAMKTLLKKGMKKLILDLRDNPGGIMDGAIQIADHFLPEGSNIVYTEGRKYPKKTYQATSEGLFENNPLVILINEGSASASEIVAGAIQDNDRGWIVGRRSFGKGLVQEELNFPDGSALRLTVARYYTPTGRCIQKPYKHKSLTEYYMEELERYTNGEMTKIDSTKLDTSKKYITPKGRVLYGGGGIVPDVFVPQDTNDTQLSNYFISGCIQQYAFKTVDASRKSFLQMYPDSYTFRNKYSIDDKMLTDLFYHCKKTKALPHLNNQKKQKLKNILKAHIGRVLYGNSAYYPILNKTDMFIQKAIELLNQKPTIE